MTEEHDQAIRREERVAATTWLLKVSLLIEDTDGPYSAEDVSRLLMAAAANIGNGHHMTENDHV
jgi:hypothetical protein